MVRNITDAFYKSVRLTWQKLTATSKALADPVERRRAKLLASVMLIFSFINLPIFIIAQINLYQQGVETFKEPSFYSWLATSISVFFIYGISRSKYYHIGAWLFASLIFLTTNFVVLLLGETDSVVGYLITVLIVSIWFGVRSTSVFTGLSIILTIFASINAPPISPASPAATIIACALLLVFVNHRNQIETDRQIELSKVNEILRKSEAKLKNSQAIAHMGDWTWNTRTNSIEWSDETYRIFGLNPEDIGDDLCTALIQIIHPDDRAMVSQFSKLIRTGVDPDPFEYRIIQPDSSICWIWTQLGDILSEKDGQVTQATGIIQDITERKKMEEALRESKQLLDNFVNNTPTYIYIKDIDGRHLFINRKFENEYNLDNEEVQGKTDYDLFPKHIAEGFRATDGKVIQTESIVSLEEISIINSEKRIHLSIKFPLYDSDGKIYAVGGISQNITEHKQAEEALSKERKLLRTILDSALDFIYVKDTEGRFIMINSAHLQSLGKSSTEVIGKLGIEVYSPEVAAQFNADEKMIIETGQPIVDKDEMRLNQMSEPIWLRTTKVPLRDDDGTIVGIVGITRDITGRKQTENSLFQQNSQLEAVLSASQDFVFILDNSKKIIDYRADEESGLYVAKEVFLGKTFQDVLPLKTGNQFNNAIENVIQNDGKETIQYRLKPPSLEGERWYEATISSKQQQLIVVVHDITERKLAEETLIYQAKLLETISDPIVASDLDYNIKSWNQGAEKLYGWSSSEVVGKNATELLKTQELDDQTFIDGKWQGEVIHTRRDGKPLHMWISTTMVQDKDNQTIGIVATGRDITERRLAQQQKIELTIQHERIQLLEEVISDLSHDIKTPLSSIMNNLYMLRKKDAVLDKHVRHLDKIELQAQRLNKLVEDILTMARLDKGATLLFAPLNLDSLIEDIGSLYYERAKEKNINLTFDLNKDLPSIHGNESELSRVFANLIENAINYTSNGNDVTVRTSMQASEISVTIRDTGIGIAKEDLLHIFDRFYRADKARRTNQGGTGLGLAITKKSLSYTVGKLKLRVS